jgi:cytochrome c
MLPKFVLPIGLTALTLYCSTTVHSQQPKNNPPEVVITTPPKNGRFKWDSIVPYAIHVADLEDGNSEYNEISTNEVLLIVRYLADSSQVKKYILEISGASQEPLIAMSTSTCLNCHASKNKLIGPSFELIAQRYPYNSATLESLAKKVMNGSTGIWGDAKMPPHPDLKFDQVREAVGWILTNGANPDQQFMTGTEGALRTKARPNGEAAKAVYVLTAIYADHGVKETQRGTSGSGDTARKGSKLGQHTVVLKNKE